LITRVNIRHKCNSYREAGCKQAKTIYHGFRPP
jgi:hypothetical protein